MNDLTEEEQTLEETHESEKLSPEKLARLKAIEVELDQLWDLLRRRRARRSVGLNPDEETVRPADVVEHYEQ